MIKARERAWRAFEETAAPANTVETWRRLPFNSWDIAALRPDDTPEFSGFTAAEAEQVRAAGAQLMTLEEAAKLHPGLVEPHLGAPLASADFRKLELANLALWRTGAFLRVPKGVSLPEPVHLRFRHDPARPFSFPRVLVIAEEGARVTVIESHQTAEPAPQVSTPPRGGGVGRSAAFSKVAAGPGSDVQFFYIQELASTAIHFWHQRVELAENARLSHHSIMLGAARHKSELEVVLGGRGAHSEIRGVLLGRGEQFSDPHTKQLHRAPQTFSDLTFRSALRDRARSIYTGLIRIERDAPDCEAYQTNKNLILSDGARADSTPILEILPDAVRCKHGSTAGPIDPRELFYLQTRGIPEAEAARMLILGFFDPILSRIPIESLRERLTEKVRREAA